MTQTPDFGDISLGGGGASRPLNREQFTDRLDTEYPDADDTRDAIEQAVDDVWPAPGYRDHQKEAIVDILANLYIADKDVVLLSAPTGAGKSLILHAVISVVKTVCNRDAFFTTPLNALIDQVNNDDFMNDDVVTLKGKNNYNCVNPVDMNTPVDTAICQRQSEFDCEYKEQHYENGGCPYYGRKAVAMHHPEVVTNMAYLMANSMIPEEHALPSSELLVVDECQSTEDFGLNFVGFVAGKRTIPVVYDEIPSPPQTENVDDLRQWLRDEVYQRCSEKLREFEAKVELTESEASKKDRLNEFCRKVQNFLSDAQDHHWVAEREYNDGDWKVKFNPIKIGRFMERFLWGQGNKMVLSSATIPKGSFLDDVGLDDRSIAEVTVPSTFPVERRPVITEHAVGKMTLNKRDKNLPKMASTIADIARHHEGTRGFVHCGSYKLAKRIYEHLPHDVQGLTRVQNREDRDEALDAWLRADVDESSHDAPNSADDKEIGGQVFLSVAMAEGVSLDDEKARWQVVAKCQYPYMGDKRVDYRLNELDEWSWYAGSAAIDLQQAVGRGMRSKDDWAITYLLDTSAVQLIERNSYLFEEWFLSAVDPDEVETGAKEGKA